MTSYYVLRPGLPFPLDSEAVRVELPAAPSLDQLRAIIMPHLVGGSDHMEHVSVLWWDRPCSMFVDECGHLFDLPFNAAATQVYAQYWLSRNPGHTYRDVSPIRGVALLFSRNVWR